MEENTHCQHCHKETVTEPRKAQANYCSSCRRKVDAMYRKMVDARSPHYEEQLDQYLEAVDTIDKCKQCLQSFGLESIPHSS